MNGKRTPRPVAIYGLLGLIPFLAPPIAGLVRPDYAGLAAAVLAAYGALILSFLGGARWGIEIARPAPRTTIVSLAMLPSLAGLALLILPAGWRQAQLLGLAAALVLHWLWDLCSRGDLPGWYPGLRTVLTAGAVAGLIAGAIVLA